MRFRSPLCLFRAVFWLSTFSFAAWIPKVVYDVYQFPNETWVENIAVRSNGELVVTLLDRPELYLINPFKPQAATLLWSAPEVLGLLGIVEVQQDRFAVIAGNYSVATASTKKGSYSVWMIDLRPFQGMEGSVITPPNITKITDIPEAIFLNGMTTLGDGNNTLLLADSGAGNVLGLDLQTNTYHRVMKDDTMAPGPPLYLGINGIHLYRDYLYYTNTAQLLARIPIHPNGTSAGEAEVIVRNYVGDDFAIDRAGNIYVAEDLGNALYKYGVDGTVRVILGSNNSSVIAGDTAAQFGRTCIDEDILYITTNGGMANPVNGTVVGGKVVAFDTKSILDDASRAQSSRPRTKLL
ncbi:hypothetical protein ANOM_011457 [Aspergillus nomiae NRRL 13137]|uniref:SMP-30/Gluconolactonase/LRE-like region domain-containing protein n=1 Tax=Aspergillus nomiae NRRL (strain ATCC 15546 / NRRL 13137 / CBS 260.88 / M93) TaxID=1509407 RepID=A0A0L1IQD4_ASPN3|nr:uncharacterized protein ANOM_011457 [Aspergillus nomiae NRRL 13137]KNG81697.1 hypothetical protein ANOM_011457 [Aspergillus nomiae NRRL 13137]